MARRLPSVQRPTASAFFAVVSRNPLSVGTTHAANVLSLRVAPGVELVTQEFASATWKTYAAPVVKLTPGAPTSAVVPAAESATPVPRLSPGRAPETLSLAMGVDVSAHALSPEAR